MNNPNFSSSLHILSEAQNSSSSSNQLSEKKQLQIQIPNDKSLPAQISSFSFYPSIPPITSEEVVDFKKAPSLENSMLVSKAENELNDSLNENGNRIRPSFSTNTLMLRGERHSISHDDSLFSNRDPPNVLSQIKTERSNTITFSLGGNTSISSAPNSASKPEKVPGIGIEGIVCEHLDLMIFKTKPCKTQINHVPKKCPFFHDYKKDRRRPPNTYKAEMCLYILNDKECPFGDNCQNCHNRVEEFYHPTKYKTKFCSSYPISLDTCEYGNFCCFAHSENDIKIDLIDKFERDTDFYLFHFKTAWCPFNETNHAREQCVYAHNWQDFRRKPYKYVYDKEQCPNWDPTKIINVYTEGCPKGMQCEGSHGWKEQEYHPLNYKMNHCRHGETCNKPHCPYYHSEKDRRYPRDSIFKLVPRNRVMSFQSQLFFSRIPENNFIQPQKQAYNDYPRNYISSPSNLYLQAQAMPQIPVQNLQLQIQNSRMNKNPNLRPSGQMEVVVVDDPRFGQMYQPSTSYGFVTQGMDGCYLKDRANYQIQSQYGSGKKPPLGRISEIPNQEEDAHNGRYNGFHMNYVDRQPQRNEGRFFSSNSQPNLNLLGQITNQMPTYMHDFQYKGIIDQNSSNTPMRKQALGDIPETGVFPQNRNMPSNMNQMFAQNKSPSNYFSSNDLSSFCPPSFPGVFNPNNAPPGFVRNQVTPPVVQKLNIGKPKMNNQAFIEKFQTSLSSGAQTKNEEFKISGDLGRQALNFDARPFMSKGHTSENRRQTLEANLLSTSNSLTLDPSMLSMKSQTPKNFPDNNRKFQEEPNITSIIEKIKLQGITEDNLKITSQSQFIQFGLSPLEQQILITFLQEKQQSTSTQNSPFSQQL